MSTAARSVASVRLQATNRARFLRHPLLQQAAGTLSTNFVLPNTLSDVFCRSTSYLPPGLAVETLPDISDFQSLSGSSLSSRSDVRATGLPHSERLYALSKASLSSLAHVRLGRSPTVRISLPSSRFAALAALCLQEAHTIHPLRSVLVKTAPPA